MFWGTDCFIIRASVKLAIKKILCAHSRACCVLRAGVPVHMEVVVLSLFFIPAGIEAQFHTSLRAIHILLDYFLFRTFSPFQSSPQFENRKCTYNRSRGRGRMLIFPDFHIHWRMCVKMDFWDPTKGTQRGEGQRVTFAGERWDHFAVLCLQGWSSEAIDFLLAAFLFSYMELLRHFSKTVVL